MQEVDEALMSKMSTEEEEAVQAELERLQQEALVRPVLASPNPITVLMASRPFRSRRDLSNCPRSRSKSLQRQTQSEKVRYSVRD